MIEQTHTDGWTLPIGANTDAAGVAFRVWAASAQHVDVVLYEGEQEAGVFALSPAGDGYFAGHIAGIGAGARYMYRLDEGDPRPDPAARSQPDGVHSRSQVVAPSAFAWTDTEWRGVALADAIFYELHVGTATEAGTFDALIERLDDLRELGVSAIELMPIADFPGERNWGYDGVCLFAPARAYGGPEGLRRLVDAAHARGLAIVLDVVYNHLGPDGNYLRQFSQDYFTSRHSTPWGEAINFDGPGSAAVRAFFIDNACYWAHEYHLDGLRLDATHAMIDDSPTHILAELTTRLHATLPADRQFLLVAENEHNDPTLLRRQEAEVASSSLPNTQDPTPSTHPPGYGLDAVWADDFHHQVRVALAGDRDGYYADYSGSAADLATTLQQGWFHVGQTSGYLQRTRGAPADDIAPAQFVHCIQNHDQVGNRALGDRLNHTIAPAAYRAATALLLLSPYTPLLFMGQEWAASTPFQYFTDHEAGLGKLVTEGRRAEFAAFSAFAGQDVPDPQARETFMRSKLRWDERVQPPHAAMLSLYRDLLALRRQLPALRLRQRDAFEVVAIGAAALALRRNGTNPQETLLLIVNLGAELQLDFAAHATTLAPPRMRWAPRLDSEDARYAGRGAAALSPNGTGIGLEGPRAVLFEVKDT